MGMGESFPVAIIKLLHILGASITLSPLGMVSVCPGGQVLLTCERMNGSILLWDLSVPHMASATTQRIVLKLYYHQNLI